MSDVRFNNVYKIYIYDVCLSHHWHQVIREDMKALGYIFHWMKLDAQFYLLRQRRERIWGCADLMSEVPEVDFCNNMKATLQSMSSTNMFEYEKVFDMQQPKGSLNNKNQQEKLKEAIRRSRMAEADEENPDVFIDCSTSKARNAEYAVHMSTCVRPTHHVYSNRLQRHLSVQELWRCQGLFKESFVNPQAVEDVMQNQAQAQDLAGWE